MSIIPLDSPNSFESRKVLGIQILVQECREAKYPVCTDFVDLIKAFNRVRDSKML